MPFQARAAGRLMSVAELTQQADVVVRARITGFSSAIMDTPQGKFPFILYQAKTTTLIAGNCPASFVVRVPGLISANRIIAPSDAPALSPGSEAVFFLRHGWGVSASDAIYDVVGLAAGVLPVVSAGPETVVIVPINNPANPAHDRIRVKLGDLSAQVTAARQDQRPEEGKP